MQSLGFKLWPSQKKKKTFAFRFQAYTSSVVVKQDAYELCVMSLFLDKEFRTTVKGSKYKNAQTA